MRWRVLLGCWLFALLPAAGSTAAQAPVEDARLLPYATPGQLVDIGGRRINLRCSGAGTPTVVLASGIASWSAIWYKAQPEIAKRTRVCSFDRASYGFSDPPSRPSILPDVVEDLHRALEAARIPGPYVLVGHSLGGVEMRLFAQRWPAGVAGMVLVDSSPAGEFLIEAGLPGVDDTLSLERTIPFTLTCGLQAERDRSRPEFQACILPLPADTPAALREVWPTFFTLDRFMTYGALLTSLATHRHDSVDQLDLGDKPLVVLSMDLCCLGDSPADRFWRNYREQWYAQHAALARLSSRGVHRVAAGASHSIMVDKPEEVVGAVEQVLRQLGDAR